MLFPMGIRSLQHTPVDIVVENQYNLVDMSKRLDCCVRDNYCSDRTVMANMGMDFHVAVLHYNETIGFL